jgi:type II secretory pathway predicted ATPase ExeA
MESRQFRETQGKGSHRMYTNHFGLRRRPFRATPDVETYYPSTGHELALAELMQAVADEEGMAVLTGEPGTGKTLLACMLMDRLGPTTRTALVTNSHLSRRADLLQAVLYDLGQPFQGMSEQELRLALTELCLATFHQGGRTVLVFDEAHHLTPELLEELRLLGNLEAGPGKALQVILIGQPSLLDTLARPELAALRQRVAVKLTLGAFSVHEAADYLGQQIRAVGGRPEEVFDEEALEVLARGTQGIARLLNQAAHKALARACAEGKPTVDAEIAADALDGLGLSADAGKAHRVPPAAEAAPAEVLPMAMIPPGAATGTATGKWPTGGFVTQQPGRAPRLVFGPGATN